MLYFFFQVILPICVREGQIATSLQKKYKQSFYVFVVAAVGKKYRDFSELELRNLCYKARAAVSIYISITYICREAAGITRRSLKLVLKLRLLFCKYHVQLQELQKKPRARARMHDKTITAVAAAERGAQKIRQRPTMYVGCSFIALVILCSEYNHNTNNPLTPFRFVRQTLRESSTRACIFRLNYGNPHRGSSFARCRFR